jgi:hypothetical protein
MMQHDIGFHAATGALGGGSLTLVNPGEKTVLRFKATQPGVFVYPCAPGGPMIPWHVVSGMSACIMVLPRDGLKDHLGMPVSYDRIDYIGENDFYIPRGEDGAYLRFADPGESYSDTLEMMNGSRKSASRWERQWRAEMPRRLSPRCSRTPGLRSARTEQPLAFRTLCLVVSGSPSFSGACDDRCRILRSAASPLPTRCHPRPDRKRFRI